MLSFQQIIARLLDFWAEKGCAVQQGYDLEVGAGTFNPATFLRCLGPEPFNSVYVEPSRRPQDGRFGDNPNRLQLFHQLQVIMKPSPLTIQDQYIQSLEALGFDLKNHDIRFVHDDWESPTLGAWGLGWEVWLDGMEVTQFTYFQSIANHPLNPISVELTYGLERLCMTLQKKESLFTMMWNETLTYGDVFHQNEREWSHYHFHEASTAMWQRHFEDFEKEAQMLTALELPLPAYDFVLKASHAFNVLEARGLFSVTERAGYIARVRELSKKVANAFLQSRRTLCFPLMKSGQKIQSAPDTPPSCPRSDSIERGDFLIEIGSEELPPSFIPAGSSSLKASLEKLMKKQNFSHDGMQLFGAPRRLSALIKNLSVKAQTKVALRKGPSLSFAFDKRGNSTPQGKGFFRSIGIFDPPSLHQLKQGCVENACITRVQGVDYLSYFPKNKCASMIDILTAHLPHMISSLSFPKKMRWAELSVAYARPISWIVTLLDTQVVPFCIANIQSGRQSRGHRQTHPGAFDIPRASDYEKCLKTKGVLVNIAKRKDYIAEQLLAIEKEKGGRALEKERVTEQVLFLSEWPRLFCASFDPKFLRIPKEILLAEMVEHQRYFPLAGPGKELAPLFVVTADNYPSEEIKMGNQHVLKARFSDAVFLYNQDLQCTLDAFGEKLTSIIFQKDLGTVAEKGVRIGQIALKLSIKLNIGSEKKVKRAAHLAKADLATALVQEFPHLQGVIGKHYALHQGEDAEVAQAIEEHWMPTFEKGPLPNTETGILISLADKLDNLACYFSVGLTPTASSDPYGMRRQTIGCIKILIESALSLNLREILQEICFSYAKSNPQEVVDALVAYITNRCKSVLEEYGFKQDEIQACLQKTCINPYDQFLKTKALHTFRRGSSFVHLYEIYKRVKGQLENQVTFPLQPNQLKEKAEVALYETLENINASFQTYIEGKDYQAAFTLLTTLQKPLDLLFDQVKILADNSEIRQNRLALLQKVFDCFAYLMDFSKIQ